MKKKTVKRLVLAKETVRSLEAESLETLRDVWGGNTTTLDPTASCRFCLPDSNHDICGG